MEVEEEVLTIPIRNQQGEEGEEVIEVPASQLPDEVEKIIDVLKAEKADLWRWLKFAVEYYKQDRIEQFEYILKEGCTGEVELYYTDDTKGRIAILNAYAAFKISQAKAEWVKNRAQSERLLTDAVEFLNRADRINNMADSTWVNKGVFNMVKSEESNALRDFSNALEINPDNLIGMLGKAAVLFKRKQFKEARDHYMRAIRTHPGCSPSIRLSLGLCFYELGQIDRAIEAFRRTLQLQPDNIDALVALSIIELNKAVSSGDATTKSKEDAKQIVEHALQRLQKAFTLDPTNSMVLNHLANHFFMKETKDYDRIDSLARNAYRNSTHERVQAEASYILGRNGHDQGKLDVAKKFYDSALTHWPDFPLARFGRAQLLMSTASTQQDVKHVVKQLEELSKEQSMKNEPDVKYMLGSLYAIQGRKEDSRKLLEEAIDAMPENDEAWIEYAQLLQTVPGTRNIKEALRGYKKVMKIFRLSGKSVSPELLCNVGVLHTLENSNADALFSFCSALLAVSQDEKTIPNSPQEYQKFKKEQEENIKLMTSDTSIIISKLDKDTITIVYNIARLMEANGSIEEAESLYKGIIEKFPFYVDCYLRLGCLCELRGKDSDASDWYKEAINHDSKHADAWAMLGALDLKRGERRPARSKFEKIVKEKHLKHDAYSRLSIANVALDSVKGKPLSPEVEKALREALGIFRAVLTLNPRNTYAANGIGVVLASRGQTKIAKQVFGKVREIADATTPDVWINLAHIAMHEENYDVAASMYEQCLKRFFNDGESELLICLASAKYHAGALEESKSILERSIGRNPDDLKAWFNLAVVEESLGTKTLNISPEERTLKEVERAVASLHRAYAVFSWLASMKPEVAKPLDKLDHVPMTPPGSPKAKMNSSADLLKLAKEHLKQLESGEIEELDNADTQGATNKKRPVNERNGDKTFKKAIKAKEHADWVGTTIKKAGKHLDRQRKLETKKKIERKKIQQKNEEAERKRREEDEKKQEEVRAKEEELRKRAQELEERNRILAAKYKEEDEMASRYEEEKKSKKRGKKSAKEQIAESSDDESNPKLSDSSDDESEEEQQLYEEPKKKKEKVKRKLADQADSDSSDDEENNNDPSEPEKKKSKVDSANEDEEKTKTPASRKKLDMSDEE